MRNRKKILAAIMAGAMVASQAVPVFAATVDSNDLNVDVSTQNAILRVLVPTDLSVVIDPFEIGSAGVQINSQAFTMQNYSQMAVKVDVESEVTITADVDLMETKQDATDSTSATGAAWLAAAAASAAGAYDDTKTVTPTETEATLTEANYNVDTFAKTADGETSSTVSQLFYLGAGSGADAYSLVVQGDTTAPIPVFGTYYELTAVASTPTSDATLQALVDASDIYYAATADAGKTGTVVKKIAKGSTVAGSGDAWTAANSYYTASTTASTLDEIEAATSGEKYVTGAMDTVGGKAEFKYIGKLNDAKETWTDADISAITISYKITGVTATNYTAVQPDLVYGYKKAAEAPVFTQGAKGIINYTAGSGDLAIDTIDKIELENGGSWYDGYNADTTIGWAAATDVSGVITFDAAFINCFAAVPASDASAKVTYTNLKGDQKQVTLNVTVK